ncbi:glutathione S-transferase family protein [Rhodophyticola sp. CCM32]|uniref:glutathione S-transferase family protein n=1 Tax=Rhodophyticola sp. CCM32 TaxID=2916397 RepID=UPI00107F58B6|nr:glutathione S-transferase family protein [Rhodophyticola sp. CCM32]QBY02811.1 glutathione S-transferase family protein [Rhodophyticola sp. CCM32]
MELIGSPASPFVRKCRAVLLETGQQDVPFTDVATTPLNTAPTAAAANPLGKIPALLRDDGPTLYDSRVITRFLDHRAQAGLYPEARVWDTLTLEATADGLMEAAVISVYEKRLRPEELWYQPWLDAQWEKVTRTLDAIETRWMSHLHGPLDMGQIAIACALGYLDFRHGDKDWRPGRDNLAAWYAGFAERPSMQGTMPPAM